MLKLKVSKTEHNRLILHAKNLLEQKQKAKWEICAIALKVCYLQDTKGKVPLNAYTITNFAKDLGMHRKTLSCWILDYQSVYLRLEIDTHDLNYKEKVRLSGAITRTRSKLFNFNRGKSSEVNKVPEDKVKAVFEEILKQDPLLKRLGDFIKNAKHHRYTIKNENFNYKHKQKLWLGN